MGTGKASVLDTGPGGLHGQWCHSTESSGAAWTASASPGEASGLVQFASARRSVCGEEVVGVTGGGCGPAGLCPHLPTVGAH